MIYLARNFSTIGRTLLQPFYCLALFNWPIVSILSLYVILFPKPFTFLYEQNALSVTLYLVNSTKAGLGFLFTFS